MFNGIADIGEGRKAMLKAFGNGRWRCDARGCRWRNDGCQEVRVKECYAT